MICPNCSSEAGAVSVPNAGRGWWQRSRLAKLRHLPSYAQQNLTIADWTPIAHGAL